jgi:hypothetical protein
MGERVSPNLTMDGYTGLDLTRPNSLNLGIVLLFFLIGRKHPNRDAGHRQDPSECRDPFIRHRS